MAEKIWHTQQYSAIQKSEGLYFVTAWMEQLSKTWGRSQVIRVIPAWFTNRWNLRLLTSQKQNEDYQGMKGGKE